MDNDRLTKRRREAKDRQSRKKSEKKEDRGCRGHERQHIIACIELAPDSNTY